MATAITTPGHAVATPLHPLATLLSTWHLLSLDAPSVAVVWTIFLARSFGVSLPWTAPAALCVAVWMLYTLDRLADARTGEVLAHRHHFHHRHRIAFARTILGAMPALIRLIVLLPSTLRTGWLLLAVPMALYVMAVHVFRLRGVPKEHLVAIFFALATAMPVLVSQSAAAVSIAPVMVAFGALCWFNCTVIGRWEHALGMDAITAWAATHVRSAATAVLIIASLAARSHPAISLACALSVLLLWVLECAQLNATLRRALADVALLSPLAMLPFLHPR